MASAWCSAAPRPPVPILLNSRVTSHIQFICPCHLSDWSSLLLPPGAVGLGAVVALPPGPGPPFCPGPRLARPRFRAGLRCWLASSASPRARLRCWLPRAGAPPPSADDAVDPNCESTPARASQRVKPDAVRAAWQRGSAAARQRASLAAARLNGRRGVRRLVRAVEGGSAAWWGVMGGVRGQFTSSEGSSSYSSDRCSPRRSPACPSRSPRRPPA